MKIAIIGATGFVGSKITAELANRHHEITAISRNGKNSDIQNVKYVAADIFNIQELAQILKGHDAVVSAYNSGWTNPNIYDDFIAGSKAIQEAVKLSGVKRFITIGGAGSLFVAPGLQAVDTPDFPKEYHAGASAARDYLNILKEEKELDWAFFSPAFEMHQGITEASYQQKIWLLSLLTKLKTQNIIRSDSRLPINTSQFNTQKQFL